MGDKGWMRRAYSLLFGDIRGLADRLGRGAKRRGIDFNLVQSSQLFDRDWYLNNYPDVVQAGIDPLAHFMKVGWREGRDPGPEFATSAYLRANADVAASGMNPLLHYIEFGHAEGRGTLAHRTFRRVGAPQSFNFASAAPCASFALPEHRAGRWQRSYRLDRGNPDLATIGGEPAGYATEPDVRAEISAASSLFGLLSGYGEREPGVQHSRLPKSTQHLADAWYVNAAQLRTRWTGQGLPFVVRAFQLDPLGDGGVSLVGEALVSSAIDPVDFHLVNSFMPLLLVFAQPDGTLTGTRIFAFPSLSRGGLHYPELVRSAAVSPVSGGSDPLSESERLAARLLGLICFVDEPAISRVKVDLEGADGTGPLFQPDVRTWLERVARISVEAYSAASRSGSEGLLAEALAVGPARERGDRGATLMLGPDMVPTIEALTEARTRGSSPLGAAVVPLLVAGAQPSHPATCIELPSGIIGSLNGLPQSPSKKWPQLLDEQQAGLPINFPPAAIRRSRPGDLHDAELLTPVGYDGFLNPAGVRKAITWLVLVKGSDASSLAHTIQSLALQSDGAADCIIFVGPVGQGAVSAARGAFGERSKTVAEMETAIGSLATPLAGFITAGVVLHDTRSAGALSAMLDDDTVDSASCVLVTAERQGKTWHAAIADPGALGTASGRPLHHLDTALAAKQLWRSTYPVAAPSPDLWVTRTEALTAWAKGEARSQGKVHLCTSLITATRGRKTGIACTPSFVPAASPDCTTKIEVLIG